MFTWKTYYVEKQRFADEAAKAQQANYEGHIMMNSTPHSNIGDRLLAFLVAQLITLGIHLQSRYSDITTPTPTQSERSNA